MRSPNENQATSAVAEKAGYSGSNTEACAAGANTKTRCANMAYSNPPKNPICTVMPSGSGGNPAIEPAVAACPASRWRRRAARVSHHPNGTNTKAAPARRAYTDVKGSECGRTRRVRKGARHHNEASPDAHRDHSGQPAHHGRRQGQKLGARLDKHGQIIGPAQAHRIMRAMLFARVLHRTAALGGRVTRARLFGVALRRLARERAALRAAVLASGLATVCAAFGPAGFAHALPVANALPAAVDAALARAGVPHAAVSVVLVTGRSGQPSHTRLLHRATEPMHPASVMKLVSTYAALELLGPAHTWRTQVFVEGAVRDGTLYGNVYLKGQGDPQLVHERLWLLLRRLQGIGIRTIAGDIVLDRSAFDVPGTDPAAFDGEPLRPYNVGPDALLINYHAVLMTFTPDPARDRALVQFDPPLFGVQTQTSVPLANGPCGDYTQSLKADFSDPLRIRFAGSYPLGCGEKVWPIAYADPASYGVRAVQGLWLAMGGSLGGLARYGVVPQTLTATAPTLEVRSPHWPRWCATPTNSATT